MSKKGNPMKGKKKGLGFLAFLLVLAIMLPASAICSSTRSEAAGLSYAMADIPTRVTAGYTLVAGTDDPGEAGAIGLNNVLSVLNENLTIPGLVVSWGDQRVFELGVLSGGYGGAAGDDATVPERKGYAFLGVGAYVLEGLHANVVYVFASRAQTNILTYVGLDVARLGPKLVSLTSAAWGKTGL